ncbi:hypothetical protein LguiB_013707 [Lonicera macranthoides]
MENVDYMDIDEEYNTYERIRNSTVSSLDDSSSSNNAHRIESMFENKIANDQKTNSIHSQEDSAVVDLIDQNGHAQAFEKANCKVDSSSDRGKGIAFLANIQPEVGKTVSATPHPCSSQRVSGQRRLVRNGCISPHNIAKAKESAKNNNGTIASLGHSSGFGTRDLISEANDSHRFRGKGVINHSFSRKVSDAKATHLSSRSSTTMTEKADGTRKTNPSFRMRIGNDDPCFVTEQQGNAITRNDYRNGLSGKYHNDYPKDHNLVSLPHVSTPPVVQTASNLGHQSGQSNDHQHTANTLTKKKKQVSNSSNHGLRILDTAIEVDEFSPKIRNTGNDASDFRARQIEADEILARELQEELYNEVPVVGVDEIDSHIALAFQREEDSRRSVFGQSRREFLPRGSLVSNIYRQSESMSSSSENPSLRRNTEARVPTSTRMARLRDRFLGQPRTTSSSSSFEINSLFPPNMDMDMRIHILEALEAFSEMEMSGNLQVHRDFNENDYEMLLALDENNHHVGASPAQINGLPQSTVQCGNLEETCAICLESPSVGDTIRHLPCLHRFHKDCIDPWLRRRTSCPVCKSSITT